jgi:hypothetical protein
LSWLFLQEKEFETETFILLYMVKVSVFEGQKIDSIFESSNQASNETTRKIMAQIKFNHNPKTY